MHVLLPDDGVFRGMFHVIDDPLLHSLYYHLRELEPQQAHLVRAAYDSWAAIYQRLPPPLQWQELVLDDGAPHRAPQGHRLRDPYGRELTPLYVVDLDPKHLDRLDACQRMLSQAEKSPNDPLADILDDLSDDHTVENFRRALAVLRIPAAPKLLESLRREAPAGPASTITLDADRTAEHHALCREVVYRLSAGDRFTYATHSALLLHA
ncbi:hypothetical protein [Streptomyces sp. NPDC046759]|uniref:hypothetical protein n=1 Tax=Streptomyces sp. NPDC046759 TaxID=3155019 RepID=UPI0033CA2AF1